MLVLSFFCHQDLVIYIESSTLEFTLTLEAEPLALLNKIDRPGNNRANYNLYICMYLFFEIKLPSDVISRDLPLIESEYSSSICTVYET